MSLSLFKKALPWLTAAIAAPATGGGSLIAQMARTSIGKVLGVDAPKDADEAAVALAGATPDQMLALQAEDHNFKLQMATLKINSVEEFERIAAGDRADARQREIKTGDSWTPRILATVFVIGYFSIQWYLLQHVVPVEMREIVMRSLGTLDLAIGLILGYYFGSSASSRGKDDTIAKLSA